MSTFTATPAPSRTIDVIVSIHETEPAVQLKFLEERLYWDHLVSFIQSSSTLELPVVLYYKLAFDAPVETLNSQEHLSQLLSSLDSPSSLRFYSHPDHVASPVFVSSAAAFARLGALVDQHKQVLKSSFHLSRLVGFLSSIMATSDRSFEREFQALEKLIQEAERPSGGLFSKNKESDGAVSAGEDEEEPVKNIDLDARFDKLNIRGLPGFGCGGPGFGFGGRGCGRRNPFGHPLYQEFFEACFDGAKKDQTFAHLFRGPRHHGRPYPPHGGPSSDSEEETGFGRFGGGKHHRHQHHHYGRSHPYGSFGGPFGGPFSFDAAPSDDDQDASGPHHSKHFGGRGGRGAFGPGFSFSFGPHGGVPHAFDSNEEPFNRPGFGGPGFGGPGFGGPQRFGKQH